MRQGSRPTTQPALWSLEIVIVVHASTAAPPPAPLRFASFRFVSVAARRMERVVSARHGFKLLPNITAVTTRQLLDENNLRWLLEYMCMTEKYSGWVLGDDVRCRRYLESWSLTQLPWIMVLMENIR